MKMPIGQLLACLLICLLGACSSTPQSNYYLLNAKAVETTTPCDCIIGIGPISIAEYLNRPQIAVSSEPGQLKIEQFQRWAEPLRDNVERVLVENLAILTGSSQLVVHPWRQDQQPRYRIAVNILNMDRRADTAVIKVQWRVIDAQNQIPTGTYLDTLSSPLVSDDYRSLAESFSQCLLQLSQHIGDKLRNKP